MQEAAIAEQDGTICTNIIDRSYRLDCQAAYALFFCNRNECAPIEDRISQGECVDAIDRAYESGTCPRKRT
jgi:hypothetical protein